jgi:predicted DNA-binding transcriptional regulator YafY
MESTGLERIIRLIGLLIGNKRSTFNLADILECDQRTVQRYIQLLRNSGFLVEYHSRGIPYLDTRRGRLKDISNLVHFNQEEAFILRKAIDSISAETPIKQNLKKKLYSIYNFPDIADIIVKPELGDIVHKIIEAIGTEKMVQMAGYQSANSNTVTDRIVEPYQFTTNYAQVWCYEPKDQKCKLFSTTRIKQVEILDEDWKYKKLHEPANLDVFRNSGFNPAGTVILHLNIRAVSLLNEEYPLAEQFIKEKKTGLHIFETQVYNFEGPARFLLGLWNDIEVIGDSKFLSFIQEKIFSMRNPNDSICR